MAEIAELWVYPVKSLLGVSLQRSAVDQRGLRLDRHWMLVDTDGQFFTQREDPALVRFSVMIVEDGIEVSSPGFGCCRVPMAASGEFIEAKVWKSTARAQIVDPSVDAWFTKAMGRACHLVAHPFVSERRINPDYGDAPLGFADAMPILVLGESSLGDLNSRLDSAVPANRFRANIILRGTAPFEEEGAGSFSSGTARMRSTKRCGRCLVTCTDQATGERADEPLRTLASYRIYGQNACMGMYYVPTELGEIEVGARVVLA